MTGTLTFVVVPKGGIDDARVNCPAAAASTAALPAAMTGGGGGGAVANGRVLHSNTRESQEMVGAEPAAAVVLAGSGGAGRPAGGDEVVSGIGSSEIQRCVSSLHSSLLFLLLLLLPAPLPLALQLQPRRRSLHPVPRIGHLVPARRYPARHQQGGSELVAGLQRRGVDPNARR